MADPFQDSSAAGAGSQPTGTRFATLLLASMFLAAMIAVSWFEAPPVPTLVGVFGAGALLYWKSRRA